jgi:hypothetical protein
MRRRSTKHHPNIAEIVQSAQHPELLEVSTCSPVESDQRRPALWATCENLDARGYDSRETDACKQLGLMHEILLCGVFPGHAVVRIESDRLGRK